MYLGTHKVVHYLGDYYIGVRMILLTEAETRTGMMIALYPDPDTAERLAIDGGTAPDKLHLTLGYCPRSEISEVQMAKLIVGLDEFARHTPPTELRISGLGRFAASSSSDGRDVLYVSVDSPKLLALRRRVCDIFAAAGCEPSSEHGFTPHITLKYMDPGDESPLSSIEPFEFTAEYAVLAVGEDTLPFELVGSSPESMSEFYESAPGAIALNEAHGSRVIEQTDKGGSKWRVLMIRSGTSANRVHYSEEVLKKAAPLFEGIQAYADHPSVDERRNRPERSVRDVVGWYDSVAWSDEHKGLVGNFNVLSSAGWLREALKSSWEGGKPDLLGFSINASGVRSGQIRDGGYLLEGITKVNSTDVVTTPGAGGRLLEMLESASNNGTTVSRHFEVFRRELRSEVDQLVEAWKTGAPAAMAKAPKAAGPSRKNPNVRNGGGPVATLPLNRTSRSRVTGRATQY